MVVYTPFGDNAVLMTFGDVVSREIHQNIVRFVKTLDSYNFLEVTDIIPAYTTITVVYDLFKTTFDELVLKLKSMEFIDISKQGENEIQIPVCYHNSLGVDLDEVSEQTGLTQEEIIQIHTKPKYLVYMLGFTPGFFYLGGLDKRLHCRRKENPRIKINKGAVGLAGNQTGVYSVDSPGGWQIIGRTPLQVFDKNRKAPFLVKQGDLVSFYEISLEDYTKMKLW